VPVLTEWLKMQLYLGQCFSCDCGIESGKGGEYERNYLPLNFNGLFCNWPPNNILPDGSVFRNIQWKFP
jgi:hypothetical protein